MITVEIELFQFLGSHNPMQMQTPYCMYECEYFEIWIRYMQFAIRMFFLNVKTQKRAQLLVFVGYIWCLHVETVIRVRGPNWAGGLIFGV